MASYSTCQSCGSHLTHLQGVTGRVSVCARCGWGRLELNSGERTLVVGAGFARSPIPQRAKALEGRQI
jgi:hypothetical protein